MKKNEKTQYQYKITISNYPKENTTSEYVVNGDDIHYTEFDDDQNQLTIVLNKKTIFSCHTNRVLECYREDALINYINNDKSQSQPKLKFNRDKDNNLIVLDINNKKG